MQKPPWIAEAEKYIGTREIRGPRHEPRILAWWRAIFRGGIRDDETPWCSAFVGAMMEFSGIRSTRFESARSWESWGKALQFPVYGCVAVFTRPGGGGHVGFVVGRDMSGNLLILGGNQGDAVSIMAFSPRRVVAYRWPAEYPITLTASPPVLAAGAPLSVNEA